MHTLNSKMNWRESTKIALSMRRLKIPPKIYIVTHGTLLFLIYLMDSYKYKCRCITIGHKSPTWLIHPPQGRTSTTQ